MLLFGGQALHYFALALTIGILFGIYSSVLVASPLRHVARRAARAVRQAHAARPAATSTKARSSSSVTSGSGSGSSSRRSRCATPAGPRPRSLPRSTIASRLSAAGSRDTSTQSLRERRVSSSSSGSSRTSTACAPCSLREARHHRDQVEEAVGDVERDDAVGLHVAQVRAERLARDEVHRDRVARERVDREHVEALRRLALERQARVAQRELDLRRAVAEVGELAAARCSSRAHRCRRSGRRRPCARRRRWCRCPGR